MTVFNSKSAPSLLVQSCLHKAVYVFGLLVLSFVYQASAHAKPKHDDILGKWVVYDNNTGLERGMLVAKKDKKKGTYFFVNIKTNKKKNPQFKDIEYCKKCPKPFTNRKVDGMTIVWNVKPVAGKPRQYEDIFGIDPKSGKIFKGSMRITDSGNTLRIRATPLETEMLYQTMTWRRKK